MNRLLYFLFSIFLSLVLIPLDSMGRSDFFFSSEVGNYPVLEKGNIPAADSDDQSADLFGIYHQEKTGIDLLNGFSGPHAGGDSRDNNYKAYVIEADFQRLIAFSLFVSGILELSQEIRKLIYPFHFFF